MAVTLYRIRKTINRITIINGYEEEQEVTVKAAPTQKQLNEKIRGKIYGRRTVRVK